MYDLKSNGGVKSMKVKFEVTTKLKILAEKRNERTPERNRRFFGRTRNDRSSIVLKGKLSPFGFFGGKRPRIDFQNE